MLLSLHYSPTAQRPAEAAFLAGAAPLDWLRELDGWAADPTELACYVVPESLASVRAAGLLVVPTGAARLPAHCREPLGRVAGRLYLPTHATLRPAATEAELTAGLLYAVQLFHPVSGLVGFEASDQLDLAALLTLGPPRPADWSRALAGPPLRPPLSQIKVTPPSLDEVLRGGRANVGTAPLAELPGQPAPPSPLQKALDKLKRQALQVGLQATQGLLNGAGKAGAGKPGKPGNPGAAAGRPGKAGAPPPAGAGGGGLLQQFNDFFTGSLSDLERRRHGEIRRLLDLFDADLDAALRFAIPLGGPYAHRGQAAPGSELGPRDPTFRLSGLGGGERVDGWDVGAHENDLRRHYQQAAAAQAATGDARKAAYIQAHLLGDYRAAARALAAGGHFREAAVLYQEHLHDLPAAAQALHQAGALPEAIALYLSLKDWEKAADLYQELGQPERATALYEQRAQEAQAQGHSLLAARLLAHKMGRPAEAEALLLAGWATPARAAATSAAADHLREYLRLLADAHPADLPAAVLALYRQHTPPARHGSLLDLLLVHLPPAHLAAHPAAEATQAALVEIGYAIIGAEAEAGKTTRLPLLRKLLPADRLLAADANRYLTRQR